MFAIDQFPEEKKCINVELSVQLNPAIHTKKAYLIYPLGMVVYKELQDQIEPKDKEHAI